MTFANSNGVSFSTGSQGLYASINAAAGGFQSAGISTQGNTAGDTGMASASLQLVGGNNITLSGSTVPGGITLTISGPNVGGAQTGISGIAGSGASTVTVGTVQFANLNGISFGLNGSTMTASHNALTQQSTQPVAVSAANGSYAFSTLTLANSNGISFSTGTQGIFGTVKTDYQSSNANYLTSQSNQAYSGANGSATFQTITFANSNGISFSTGTQGLFGTVKTDYQSSNANYLTSQSNQAFSAANGSATFQTFTLANSNGLSFSTGTQGIYGSHNALTQQSTQPVAASAANGSFNFSTLTFANSNGISFSTGTQGLYASVNAGGGAAIQGSGTYSQNTGTVQFANSNGVTFGLSNNGVMTCSVVAGAAAGIGAINNSNTTYTSGTVQLIEGGGAITIASGTGQRFAFSVPATSVFSAQTNITIGTTGSTIGFSVADPGGGAGYTAMTAQNRQLGASTTSQIGQNSLWLTPIRLAAPLSASTMMAMMSWSGTITSAATAQHGESIRMAIWSQNAGTTGRFDTWWSGTIAITFWNSGTSSYSYNYGGTTGSSAGSNLGTASVMGPRIVALPIGSTMPAGLYIVGMVMSSSTAGYSAAMSRNALFFDNPLALGLGTVGQATNNSIGYLDGGTFSVTTGNIPATISIGDIRQTANLMPYFKIGAL